MNGQKLVLTILSVLISISLAMSGYIFTSMEKRLITLEVKVYDRGERIAILEQQAKENSSAHARLESKLDAILSVIVRK
jgi:uncharacterized coiled-coil protein SlyX